MDDLLHMVLNDQGALFGKVFHPPAEPLGGDSDDKDKNQKFRDKEYGQERREIFWYTGDAVSWLINKHIAGSPDGFDPLG